MKSSLLSISICLALFLCQCRKDCPVSGLYTSNVKGLTANVVDSTLYLLFSDSAMAFYQLGLDAETENYILYSLRYSGSLTSTGFEEFPFTLDFLPNKYHGGMITLIFFTNKTSFDIGGYNFKMASSEEGKLIFERWKNLLNNNLESKIFKIE